MGEDEHRNETIVRAVSSYASKGVRGEKNKVSALAQARDILAKVRTGGTDPRTEKAEARRQAGEKFGGRLPEYLALQRLVLRPRSFIENQRHLEVMAEPLHIIDLLLGHRIGSKVSYNRARADWLASVKSSTVEQWIIAPVWKSFKNKKSSP
jgi:hypothetical protein